MGMKNMNPKKLISNETFSNLTSYVTRNDCWKSPLHVWVFTQNLMSYSFLKEPKASKSYLLVQFGFF